VKIAEIAELRSVDQNKMMWDLLGDLSEQLKWPVNGYVDYLSKDDWKDILTAGLEKEQRVAQGIDGGWVLLGQRTHRFPKDKMSELIELILEFGARHNIRWTHEP